MNPVSLFKSLADETRLNIVLLVTETEELCVCDLTDALSLSQPKISRHLAALRAAEILLDHRRGKWVYYSLHPGLPKWVSSILTQTRDAHHLQIQGYLSALSDNQCC